MYLKKKKTSVECFKNVHIGSLLVLKYITLCFPGIGNGVHQQSPEYILYTPTEFLMHVL